MHNDHKGQVVPVFLLLASIRSDGWDKGGQMNIYIKFMIDKY